MNTDPTPTGADFVASGAAQRLVDYVHAGPGPDVEPRCGRVLINGGIAGEPVACAYEENHEHHGAECSWSWMNGGAYLAFKAEWNGRPDDEKPNEPTDEAWSREFVEAAERMRISLPDPSVTLYSRGFGAPTTGSPDGIGRRLVASAFGYIAWAALVVEAWASRAEKRVLR